MENISRIAIIVGVLFSLIIGVLVTANFSTISGEITALVSDSVAAEYSGYTPETSLPSLEVEKISAPANGSVAKAFEIVIDEPREPAPEPEVAVEPEVERTFMEKVKLMMAAMGAWLTGKDPSADSGYTMDCKKKKDGGKVCSINRDG